MPGKTGSPPGKQTTKGNTSPPKGGGKHNKRKASDAGSESSSKVPDNVSFEISQSEGNTFRTMGMYKKAVNSYTRALSTNPKHKGVLLARSQCFQQLGQNDLAMSDANDVVAQDRTSVKGLLQKADVYYQMGQFEYALMLYHRGHKFRPEVQGFRLGIQKSKEAIENSIGENSGIKLEKKGDLSFFIEEQKPPSKRKDANQQKNLRQTNQDKRTTPKKRRSPNVKDKKTVKELLGELYEDVTYLEGLLNESEKTTKTKANEQVTDLASECLDYLDSRAEFWQQQQPTYSREQERANRARGLDTTQQTTKQRKKENPTKWILDNMELINESLDNKEFEECIDRSNRVLKEMEKYSETEVPRRKEFAADLHSYMGNAYIEMEEYEEAMRHHQMDYDIAKELESSQGIPRALDNLGRALAKMGHHRNAIEIFTERLSLNCTVLEEAWLYHELGRCHLELDENEEALEYGGKSQKAAEEADDQVWQLNSSILIAETQRKLKNDEKAFETFQKALELAEELKDIAAEQAIRKTMKNIKNEDAAEKETTEEDQQTQETKAVETGEKEAKVKVTSYKVTVTISDLENAGTDSSLEVEIFGTEGRSTGRLKLEASETNARKHDRGQTDSFSLEAKDVGEITKITVRQTSELPGKGCHIYQVTVQSRDAAHAQTFKCDKWFDKALDDGLIERELLPEK